MATIIQDVGDRTQDSFTEIVLDASFPPLDVLLEHIHMSSRDVVPQLK